VQAHWRHMQLLSRGWPQALSARAGEAKELSQLLGEDHDYAILLAFADGRAGSALEPADLAALAAFCGKCQAELRERARPHAMRLFAESGKDLRARLKLYWSSAQRLAACPPNGPGKPSRSAAGTARRLRERVH
jgi:hypothetical protein